MAARLAERGIRTLVCEEHARVGDPVHCTGVLSADSFARFDLPDSATLNQLTSVRFLSPGGIPVDYATPAPLATVIDRPVFDRALADRALAAGAEIRVGARVSAVETDEAGARATIGGAVVHARMVVLACGASYRLPAALRLRSTDVVPADRPARAVRAAAPATSSCISARTSRRAALPGPCRCCAPAARACGSA